MEEYRGYRVASDKDKVIVLGVQDFNAAHTFECGQCFRWNREDDGSYSGVAGAGAVNVAFEENDLIIRNTNIEAFKSYWFNYFDLGRDYSQVKKLLLKDDIMAEAIKFGYGIRILKQDLWETLISFIISANNRIPQIKKVVAAISAMYGEDMLFEGVTYHTFPKPDRLAGKCAEDLSSCKGGFRCKYIAQASLLVNSGEIDLGCLANMELQQARIELMRFPGIGQKVADCTLLYSGISQEVFPTDVWVKRVMEELYFKREASFAEIHSFAAEYFGPLAGFAQQYLFYYARENKIGV